jgi:hypothetical protein
MKNKFFSVKNIKTIFVIFIFAFMFGFCGIAKIAKHSNQNENLLFVNQVRADDLGDVTDDQANSYESEQNSSGNETSTTTADCSDDPNSYASGSDCYCQDGYSENSAGKCEKIDLSTSQCETDGDCIALRGDGYACNDGDCELSSGSECKNDTDCVNNIGPGYTCSSNKTCEEKSTGSTTTALNSMTTASGIKIPSGSTVTTNSNGTATVTSPNGTTQTISAADAASLAGSTSGLPGGVAGVSSGVCDAGFSKVGGVCFPSNTGLSSAPISTILSNIFSWLMGLFTTIALIAFLISGIQYLTSAGDEDQIAIAKRNATYALLGVLVGLSGFVIVQAIAAAISGGGYVF